MPSLRTGRIDYSELIDEDLVAHVRQGESRAFGVLTQRYNRRLFRIARGIVRDDAEAEDVVQEAYLRAYAALPDFRGASRFSTWLTRIVVNVALGRLRRRHPTEGLDSLDGEAKRGDCPVIPFPGVTVDPSPEAYAARAQVRRLLERAVDDLPDPFRLVFMMRSIEEMSIEETAASLGIRPETVKTRLHRARKLLRRNLAETLATVLKDAFPFEGVRCERITRAVLDQVNGAPHSVVHYHPDAAAGGQLREEGEPQDSAC